MKLSHSQLPSAPYSLFKRREDPAYPKLSWTGGAQAQLSFGRSGSPRVEEAFNSWLPARGCGLQGEGVDKGHCSAATVTFSYADLQQECTLWPCSCFHTFSWVSAPRIHTHDTELARTALVCTAHEASESPPAALLLLTLAAQQPDVLTKARCMATTTRHPEVELQVTWISEMGKKILCLSTWRN